jgi:hypothetical protein
MSLLSFSIARSIIKLHNVRPTHSGQTQEVSITNSRRAPEDLEFWLDLIQDIPPAQELLDWGSPETSGSGNLVVELLTAWDAVISKLPYRGQRYVRFDRDNLLQRDVVASHERYRLLKVALNALRMIARNKGTASITGTDFSGLIGLRINAKGGIEFELSPVYKALQGVEAGRIRECKNFNCRRIFWAGRLDQSCCNKKCANIRRVRKWRENYLEVYKQNRLEKEDQSPKAGPARKSPAGAPQRNRNPRKGR